MTNIGDPILLKAKVRDQDSNPHGSLIWATVEGDPKLTYPYQQEIQIHRLDRKQILLCPTYPVEMSTFAMAMSDKMEAKEEEYGDSWKNMPISDLVQRLKEEFDEFYPFAKISTYDRDELVDIANICMMLYHRISAMKKVTYYCDICDKAHICFDDGYVHYCGYCDSKMERMKE